MANPNPQPIDQKYKGVREAGYGAIDLNSQWNCVRFGKKVNYANKLTKDDVLEAHLQQMRRNEENNRAQKELKRRQEQDFLERIKSLEEMEQTRIRNGLEAMRKDQNAANEIIAQEKKDKDMQYQIGQKEEVKFFPFVAGDHIERHRANLGC